MNEQVLYLLAADLMLATHVLFVLFVVGGQVAVMIGWMAGWGWVRNFTLRLTHLAAIGVVVVQSWLGIVCPLTTWEMALRARAGDAVYAGAFIAHWLERMLYYQAPEWVFTTVYSVFALLVAASWIWVRPVRKHA